MSLKGLLNCLDGEVTIAKQALEQSLANTVFMNDSQADGSSLSEELGMCLDNHLPSTEKEQILDYLEERVALYNVCAKREMCLNTTNTAQSLQESIRPSHPN